MDKLLCLADLIYVKDVEILTHEGRFMLFLSSDRYNKKTRNILDFVINPCWHGNENL